MTAPIPQRSRRLPLAAYRWLLSEAKSSWYYLELGTDEDAQRAFWEQHRNTVVQHHIKRFPGSRPRLWWRMDAPGPRRRVGGIGDTLASCSNTVLVHIYGVPMHWVTGSERYLTGGVPISVASPPKFESETNYLRRHNLLLPEERSRLLPHHYEPWVILHRGDRFHLVRHDRVER
jgi:hypothetical protein